MKQKLLALPVAFIAVASLQWCTDIEEPDTATVEQSAGSPPNPAGEEFANAVADAMIDRLVALLFREFAVTTADNAAVGSAAISNIFFDANYTMRLVGDVGPLQATNLPQDDFEMDALAAAKQGLNYERTEKIGGTWWVRKSLAVATTFSPSCVHCHPNFVGLQNPWVGALMVRASLR